MIEAIFIAVWMSVGFIAASILHKLDTHRMTAGGFLFLIVIAPLTVIAAFFMLIAPAFELVLDTVESYLDWIKS